MHIFSLVTILAFQWSFQGMQALVLAPLPRGSLSSVFRGYLTWNEKGMRLHNPDIDLT